MTFNTNQFAQFADQRHAEGKHFDADEVAALPPTHYSALLNSAASYQRGKPESAMNDAQRQLGTGVLPHALEHVGDLTHRMAEEGGAYGTEYVAPKVRQTLRSLEHPYGFEREAGEQLRENAKYASERGRTPPTEDTVRAVGQKYADEHRQVPAYTRPMYLGRAAAVALGEGRYGDATSSLRAIQRTIDHGEDHFRAEMAQPAAVEFLRRHGSGPRA